MLKRLAGWKLEGATRNFPSTNQGKEISWKFPSTQSLMAKAIGGKIERLETGRGNVRG